ncbi:MAG: YkgJ family cysteine cluster protein [Deltaproteobacteria bacterium]|nr:YkgJ family cysteine cluster protein [Deltaproteobacteria bacterium]
MAEHNSAFVQAEVTGYSYLGKFQLLLRGMLLALWTAFARYWLCIERIPPFLSVAFTGKGFGSWEGRILIWGKIRRLVLSFVPRIAKTLQKKYGLVGGCQNCGSSCQLLFQCPHWDDRSGLCSVYELRPNICRLFPITPADIRDRNLAAAKAGCGFTFAKKAPTPAHPPHLVPQLERTR